MTKDDRELTAICKKWLRTKREDFLPLRNYADAMEILDALARRGYCPALVYSPREWEAGAYEKYYVEGISSKSLCRAICLLVQTIAEEY